MEVFLVQRSVEIKNRGLALRGMLHTPEKVQGKIPIVCMFHGFTGDKLGSHFMFVRLSRLLANKGIATLRFDFMGSGESDGDFVDMTLSKELDDAKVILSYAKSLDFVDTERIGILGFSMGGAVASMLAGDCKDDIKTLCLWAPAGNMSEIAIAGKSKDDIERVRKIGCYDLDGYLVGINFIDDVLNLDIFDKSHSYDKNVLLIHGTKDTSVPFSTSEKYLGIYETRGVLHSINGANHSFNSRAFENEVLDYTIGFLEGELNTVTERIHSFNS
jgi:dipeptidyl aminopeptidase/acylaminoacyl peptidase